MNDIINILKYRLVGLNVLLIFLAASLLLLTSFAGPVFFILTSNLYDILGYHFGLIRRSKVMPEKIIVRSYRITQIMFDLTLLILLGIIFNASTSLSGAILKLFGVQDVLYYLFLQMKLPVEWTWLKWTPFGFLFSTLSREIVLIQSAIGVISAALIMIL